MERQSGPLVRRFVGFGLVQWELGFNPCQIDLEILEAKLQLVVIEPLGGQPNWWRCNCLMMRLRRSISALASRSELRSTASERTSCCRAPTSSGKAARSMSMTMESADSHRSRRSACMIESISRRTNPRLPEASAVPERARRRLRSAATAAPKSTTASPPV